jgi:hypothetical protein
MIDSTTSQIYFQEFLDAKAESFNVDSDKDMKLMAWRYS